MRVGGEREPALGLTIRNAWPEEDIHENFCWQEVAREHFVSKITLSLKTANCPHQSKVKGLITSLNSQLTDS